MNGIISLLKVFIEGISLVGGLAAAYFFFAQGWHTHQIEDTLTSSSLDIIQIIELVTLSFIASLSFGIVFNVGFKDIVFSGIGGAIVRIVYVLFSMITEYRIVYTIVAAFCAALYAEILAITRKEPGTVYLYPSIIPLIPGDLLYYTSLGILWGNSSLLVKAGDCAIQLFAMSIGFVLCSTIIHYIRKIRFKKLIKALENSFITK